MAPEMLMQLPYQGNSVDLFALHVILFNLATGSSPFVVADKRQDLGYKLMMERP